MIDKKTGAESEHLSPGKIQQAAGFCKGGAVIVGCVRDRPSDFRAPEVLTPTLPT